MSENSVTGIIRLRKTIDSNEKRIMKLKRQIYLLECAKCEVKKMKCDFIDFNNINNRYVTDFLIIGSNVPFVKQLHMSLRSQVNGHRYDEAVKSFDLLDSSISKKILAIRREILFLRDGVSIMDKEINLLRKDL